MNSKQIAIAIGLLILVGSFVFFNNSRKPQLISGDTGQKTVIPTPTPSPVTLLTWTDEAGFSFQYPEGTSIDNHPEDSENYANLTLTLPSLETIDILMSDNKYKDLVAWVGKRSALDTTLEGRPAKKIVEGGISTIACVDNEIIVTITGKDISTIVDTWTFIYPSPTVTANKNAVVSDDSGDVLEEE